jgi:hypothetical protein
MAGSRNGKAALDLYEATQTTQSGAIGTATGTR